MRWMQRVGPGFVYVLTAMGAGDLVSNSAAGAGYGYALIWTIIPAAIFRFVWVSVSAKYVLVTQESLIQGYARVSRLVIWILLGSVLIMGHFYMMYTIVMTGNAIEALLPSRFPWSSSLWSLLFAVLAFVMTYWGGYRIIEKFLRVGMVVMVGGLVTAVVLARPDPAQILQGALIPSIPGDHGLYGTLFIVMAIVGTMAGSITNLTYAYFIREKGWRDVSHLRRQRVDLLMSALCLFMIAGLLQVAVGAVAVHGYAGVVGLIICGFVLNGYPSSGYSVGAMWDGSTYASINPLGQLIGAFIMFVVLGLIPGYILAKILNGMGKLRIPRDVEIAGLDYEIMETAKEDEKAVSAATK